MIESALDTNHALMRVMSSALSTGSLFGREWHSGPEERFLHTQAYIELQRATIQNLRPVLGPLLPAAVLTNAAVLLLERDDRSVLGLQALGPAGQLSALVLTGASGLPITRR